LSLGIGQKDEPYEGIGRGVLNIEGLPVYRDQVGGIGTPTSDHERTKITLDTTHLLVLINGYDGNEENIVRCGEFIQDLAVKYLMATNSKILIYK
jgi:DNA/RNA-binding domain of Phe-tRNA-synthetase-like protein